MLLISHPKYAIPKANGADWYAVRDLLYGLSETLPLKSLCPDLAFVEPSAEELMATLNQLQNRLDEFLEVLPALIRPSKENHPSGKAPPASKIRERRLLQDYGIGFERLKLGMTDASQVIEGCSTSDVKENATIALTAVKKRLDSFQASMTEAWNGNGVKPTMNLSVRPAALWKTTEKDALESINDKTKVSGSIKSCLTFQYQADAHPHSLSWKSLGLLAGTDCHRFLW